MHRILRLAQIGTVTVSALLLTGCASMKVYSYPERGVDFAQYRTYNWGPPDHGPTGDPRLDSNPFFHERIQAAVEWQLASRGYLRTTAGQPDLTIHYRAITSQEVDANGADRETGYCGDDECEPSVYDVGTLTFDLVDTHTNRVVWRGWAEGSVDGVVNNQAWMEQKIDEVVARIFDKCPRRP